MFKTKKRLRQENEHFRMEVADLTYELDKTRALLNEEQQKIKNIENTIASNYDFMILNKGIKTNVFVEGVPLKRIWRLDFSQKAGQLPKIDFKS